VIDGDFTSGERITLQKDAKNAEENGIKPKKTTVESKKICGIMVL